MVNPAKLWAVCYGKDSKELWKFFRNVPILMFHEKKNSVWNLRMKHGQVNNNRIKFCGVNYSLSGELHRERFWGSHLEQLEAGAPEHTWGKIITSVTLHIHIVQPSCTRVIWALCRASVKCMSVVFVSWWQLWQLLGLQTLVRILNAAVSCMGWWQLWNHCVRSQNISMIFALLWWTQLTEWPTGGALFVSPMPKGEN